MNAHSTSRKSITLLTAWALATLTQAAYVEKAQPGDDLAAVRDRIRAARQAGTIKPGEKVEVVLADGLYVVKKPLALGKDDGGDENAPVVWRAENPGKARIRGAATLKPSDFAVVSDAALKARFPAAVRDKVREANLKAYFPVPPKEWGKVFTHVPDAPWAYCGGETLELARWPNAGANDLTGPEPQEKGWCWFTKAVDLGVDPTLPGKEREYPLRPGAIQFKDPRAKNWKIEEGVWMYGYWVHDWYAAYQRIGSFTPSNQVVRFADKVMFGVGGSTCGGNKRRFMVINVPEELDAPGEWWFDRKTCKFYCLPPAGKENEDVQVALATRLVETRDAAHVRFEGLAFEYTHVGGSAVSVVSCTDVVFRQCEFRHHAGTGLGISGGKDCVAEQCTFAGFGGNAISVSGGDRRWLVPARHAILRCDVSDYARWNRQAMPITFGGCGCALRGTRVHDGPCGAISYGGNDHLVAENEFDHVMLEACDAGALYTGRNTSTQGHLVFGNNLHDLSLDPSLRAYRSGFYFDDCDWGDDVVGNRVEGVGLGVHVGGGSMHGIYNNVFVDCITGIGTDTRGWGWKRAWRGSFAVDPKTGLGWAETCCAPFHVLQAPWSVAYPRLGELLGENPEYPHGNVYSNNVFVCCKKPLNVAKDAVRTMGAIPPEWNCITTNAAQKSEKPRQSVALVDAKRCAVLSPDTLTEMTVALDITGHLTWRLAKRENVAATFKTALATSRLGVSVDGRDFGRCVVPGEATLCAGEGAFFTNCWRLLVSGAEKPCTDCVMKEWKGAEVPLRDLVTGATCAWVDVRVWNGGAAFRWRIGEAASRRFGEVRVAGEMNDWTGRDAQKTEVLEADRGKEWPEFYLQKRSSGVEGVVFPEYPRGWNAKTDAKGQIIFPWRVTRFK